MNTTDRLPPHSREAEQELLGAMLHDDMLIPEIAGSVSKADFYVVGHQLIFSAIMQQHDSDGGAVDVVSVAEHLIASGGIVDAGGAEYLAELHGRRPSANVHDRHAATIRRHSIARKLIEAGGRLEGTGKNLSLTVEEMLADAERQIAEIADGQNATDIHHVRDTVAETWAAIDEQRGRSDARFSGVPSGFTDLDAMTAGFQPGEFIIIAARPSCGKTAAAVNIARHVAVEERVPVLFLSLEQSRVELTERLLCCQAQADGHRLRTGRARPAESARLLDAGELLTRSAIYIDDSPNQTLTRIAASARRMNRTANVGLVIIDYLQLITVDGKKENRQEQVAGISRRMKLLARELGIPVIVLAQLNRQVETRQDQRPKLSDLRESGALEQDADVVLMLHRQDEGIVDLIVQKQRNGPTGDARLIYVKQHMRFENYTGRP